MQGFLPVLAQIWELIIKLLFHLENSWLSKGNMPSRLYKLKHEVEIFLQGQEQIIVWRFDRLNFSAFTGVSCRCL
jgi:hypothetical protein